MSASPIVDCFSFLTPAHPLLAGSPHGYLLAPNPTQPLVGLEAFPAQVHTLLDSRAGGALLPLTGMDAPAFERAVCSPGWKALLLTNAWSELPLDDLEVRARLYHPALQHLPVLVEAGLEGFSRPDALKTFLEATPDRPVILAHGGQLNICGAHLQAARALFADHPNTWLETSGIYRQDFLEDLLELLGPGRILYGSGFPRMDERLERERVRLLPTDRDARARMLGGNARALLRLD